MNITRLNTLNDDKVIVKGGNGGNGNYKYVIYTKTSKDFGEYSSQAKFIKGNELFISVSSMVKPLNADSVLAFSIDFNSKFLLPQGNINVPTPLGQIFEQFGVDLSQLPYITEEEFYHIPQDEVWPLNTQEDYKAAWDKLYPLVERYGADYINENRLSLAPWYKSLTIGNNNVTELYGYWLEDNGDFKRECISFTQYTGIEKYTYTDGTIEYQSYNPPM